ncbi:Hypothetical predicted protein, partial [Paramuricea clavata]
KKLRERGYEDMTLKEIINKIKKLKQKYESEKDKAKKSGNGRKKPWKYFQQLDRFLSQRHNVVPAALLDSMAEADHEKDNESDMQKDHVDDENHDIIE